MAMRLSVTVRGTICVIIISMCLSEGVNCLMCLECTDVVEPRHCHSITYCAEDENCHVERIVSRDGIRYNSGCLQKHVCAARNTSDLSLTSVDGSLYTSVCSECCSSDLCNSDGCGTQGYPSQRGPMCLSCSQIPNPEDCRHISHCRESEVCHVTEELEFGDKLYSMGCMPFQQCSNIASRFHSITHLSNSHHFTRSTPKTTIQTNTLSSTEPAPTLNIGHVSYSRFTPFIRKNTSNTVHGKFTTTLPHFGVAVVGKRESKNKRYISCTQCCHGDLCNYQCSPSGIPTIVHQTYFTTPSITTTTSTKSNILTTKGQNPRSTTHTNTAKPPHVSTSTSVTLHAITSTDMYRSTMNSMFTSSKPDTMSNLNKGSVGKEFLLVFSNHDNGHHADNISLLVTSRNAGHITVYLPFNETYLNTTLKKGDNEIFIDPHVTVGSLIKERKGVHIQTDVDVSIHVLEYRNIADTGYLALPVHALSASYVTSTQDAFPLNPSYISVAAIHNSTTVHFQLKLPPNETIDLNGKHYGDGDVIRVDLNYLETFQLASASVLTGTIVNASKPIAVFSGNTFTIVPKPNSTSAVFDAQTLSQMIPPIASLGSKFIVPRLQNRDSYFYKVISVMPNTTVKVQGQTFNLQSSGQWMDLESIDGRSVNISSNKPVLVVQIASTMKSHYDTASGAMIITPAIEQFQNEYNFTVPNQPNRNLQTKYKTYISIIAKSNETSGIQIDGKGYEIYNSNLQTVILDGMRYSVISLQIDSTGFRNVKSIDGSAFGLIMYGFDYAQGYGYPVGLKL